MATSSVHSHDQQHQTLTAVGSDDPRRGSEIAFVGFAKSNQGLPPPQRNAVKEVFSDLWTRLDQATFHLDWLSKKIGRAEVTDDDLRNDIEKIIETTSVQRVYDGMMRKVAEVEDGNREREEAKDHKIGDLWAANRRLVLENKRMKAELAKLKN